MTNLVCVGNFEPRVLELLFRLQVDNSTNKVVLVYIAFAFMQIMELIWNLMKFVIVLALWLGKKFAIFHSIDTLCNCVFRAFIVSLITYEF